MPEAILRTTSAEMWNPPQCATKARLNPPSQKTFARRADFSRARSIAAMPPALSLAEGSGSRPSCSRTRPRRRSQMRSQVPLRLQVRW